MLEHSSLDTSRRLQALGVPALQALEEEHVRVWVAWLRPLDDSVWADNTV
jgi:hypothetical protein